VCTARLPVRGPMSPIAALGTPAEGITVV